MKKDQRRKEGLSGKHVFRKRYLTAAMGLVLAMSLTACGQAVNGKNALSGPMEMSDSYTNGAMAEAPSYAAEAEEGYYTDDYAGATEAAPQQNASAGSGNNAERVGENAASDRKLIKTVDLDVETQEFEALLSSVEQKVSELQGYIENMESYNGSNYSSSKGHRYANLTLRIPKENLSRFVNNIAENSNVVRRTESVQDVTLNYVDLASHKKVLQAEHDKLVELIERADTTEDIIVLQQRASEVRYQIESMESQLRTYDNKVDYSTVYLYIDEVEIFTPVVEETVWERISGGFAESLNDVYDGLVDFVVWLIVSIPYLIIWAVVIGVIVLIIKGMIRHSKKKKEKKRQQLAEKQQMQISETGQKL